jgi:hypothetical protein
VPSNEVLASAAFFIASVLAALYSYIRKPPPAPPTTSAVITGIGGELGNRQQMDMLIHEVRRIADAAEKLVDQKQISMREKMDELLERLEEAEKSR